MILSAGLTPALQQILVFDAFQCGQVNRAREARWCASGKVFNAGIAVHHLGGPSLTLAPVGGPPRELIGSELPRFGPLPKLGRRQGASGLALHFVVPASLGGGASRGGLARPLGGRTTPSGTRGRRGARRLGLG